jgi:CheY-like chemotaxis protein
MLITTDDDLAAICEAMWPAAAARVSDAAGLACAAAVRPRAIVFDLNHPSGWDIVAELRHTSATRHIPVLLLTGCVVPEGTYRRRARQLGCRAFVAKPCAPSVLARTLNKVLRGGRDIEVIA